VESGRVAVLDATYGRERHRRAVLAWAGERRIPAWLVHVHCTPQVALSRLRRRAARDRDPADARPELLDVSRAAFEAPVEWPGARVLPVATDDPDWRVRLARLRDALGGGGLAAGEGAASS